MQQKYAFFLNSVIIVALNKFLVALNVNFISLLQRSIDFLLLS